MAFGFFSNSQGPVDVTCPFCSSTQPESILTVSTNCKRCFAYLKVLEGEVLESHPAETEHTEIFEPAETPDTSLEAFSEPSDDAMEASNAFPEAPAYLPLPEVAPPPPKPKDDTPPLLQDPQTEPAPGAIREKQSLPALRPGDPPPENPADRLAYLAEREAAEAAAAAEAPEPTEPEGPRYRSRPARENERMVQCFDCPVSHPVPLAASSTLCPECGQYLSLEDQEIKGRHNNRVRTRGNVIITKRAKVAANEIFCHDLVIEGEFSGTAHCSGNLTIRHKGNLGGPFHCQSFHVADRAKVTFSAPVHVAQKAEIDGDLRGDVLCDGPVHLHKNSLLTGALRCSKLDIDSGATHDGTISVGRPD